MTDLDHLNATDADRRAVMAQAADLLARYQFSDLYDVTSSIRR